MGGCPRTVWKSSLGASVNEAKVVKIPTATNFVIIHRHSVLLIQFVVMFLEVTAEERYKLLTGKLRVSHYQNAERLELQIRKISQTIKRRVTTILMILPRVNIPQIVAIPPRMTISPRATNPPRMTISPRVTIPP